MSTTEAAFYDRAMVVKGAPSMLPLIQSPWRDLYAEAGSWIAAHEDVVDLGCGTGRFLHSLHEANHYAAKLGVDFSTAALDEAERYLRKHKTNAELTECDLRDWTADPDRAANTVYVCLETLEHLEDDRDLVGRIPPGHRFVFSVPNYESKAHLRTFGHAGEVWERFSHLLEFRRWSLVRLNERKAFHVCDSLRRLDAW